MAGYAGAGSVSCAEDGVAVGDEPGAVGGMDGSLETASLADLKGGLSADKQATFELWTMTTSLGLIAPSGRAAATSDWAVHAGTTLGTSEERVAAKKILLRMTHSLAPGSIRKRWRGSLPRTRGACYDL
jgi:hypothetical protein